MKKAKYLVLTNRGTYESESRNARKHLTSGSYDFVIVTTNKGHNEEVISQAIRQSDGLILVGARKN